LDTWKGDKDYNVLHLFLYCKKIEFVATYIGLSIGSRGDPFIATWIGFPLKHLHSFDYIWHTPKLFDGLTASLKVKTMEGKEVNMRFLARNISGVEGHVGALGWGLRRLTSNLITQTDLHKPNSKLVNALLEHFWCTDEPHAHMDKQDSPWPGLGGSHHLPSYSILFAWPWDQHPNVILSRNSQVGVSNFPKLGLLRLWRLIILCADL
jgi:hypothetical protein